MAAVFCDYGGVLPTNISITRKMVPITGRASSFLEEKKMFLKSNLSQIHSFFCSSFFLCLQGQPELCGCYHLLQSCFSFYVRLHGQPELFELSDHLLCLRFLSNSFSSHHFNLLRVARRCFSWSSVTDDLFFSSIIFFVLLHALSFSRPILSLSLLCSSVTEALFALL